jgi:hypothetical protein
MFSVKKTGCSRKKLNVLREENRLQQEKLNVLHE